MAAKGFNFVYSPPVTEDGIVTDPNALDGLKFKTYETRVAELGNKRFPLNLYGDADDCVDFRTNYG